MSDINFGQVFLQALATVVGGYIVAATSHRFAAHRERQSEVRKLMERVYASAYKHVEVAIQQAEETDSTRTPAIVKGDRDLNRTDAPFAKSLSEMLFLQELVTIVMGEPGDNLRRFIAILRGAPVADPRPMSKDRMELDANLRAVTDEIMAIMKRQQDSVRSLNEA